MMQVPLYIDAAEALPADRAALADVQSTPARRGKCGGHVVDWDDARRKSAAALARAIKEGRHVPGPEGRRDRFTCTAAIKPDTVESQLARKTDEERASILKLAP
jgi:hypothetical protein